MIAQNWLKQAFSNPRAEVIIRRPGEGWVSAKGAWALEQIADQVENSEQIIGIRPEGLVRVIFLDFDHKPNGATSTYWHKKAESKELLALQEEAERCGLQLTFLVSSDSGGLHGVLSLPVGVKAWLAHWVGVELLNRCDMKEAAGQAEVFPSEMRYSKGERNTWARSNGVRLPGQQGSKLIAGDVLLEDQGMIYDQLLCDLENTEQSESWQQLLNAAMARPKQARQIPLTYQKKNKSHKTVKWTSSGQSEKNLAQITTLTRLQNPNITCEYELAELIRRSAIQCEGYDEFASDETKKELSKPNGGWALRWARSSLRKPFKSLPSASAKISGDKEHNIRLYKESQAKLKELFKACSKAKGWSKRKVAAAAGMARRTLEKHWEYWLELVAYTPTPNNGGDRPAEVGEAMDAAWNVLGGLGLLNGLNIAPAKPGKLKERQQSPPIKPEKPSSKWEAMFDNAVKSLGLGF